MNRFFENGGWKLCVASCAVIGWLVIDRELMPGLGALLLVMSCLLGAQLITGPHGSRIGAGRVERLRAGALLGFVLVLPLIPFLALQRSPPATFYFTLFLVSLLALVAARHLASQGRYALTERELPDLEGEKRAVAEEVIKRSGLVLHGLRVGVFPSFNAVVHGFRSCLVTVDRRASEALPAEEFAALVAHEAGHVRYGGALFYLLALTAPMALINTAALLGHHLELSSFLGALLWLETAPRQWMELVCDRHAAKLAGAGATARMLERIHADFPAPLERLMRTPWFYPFLSHPPLHVRAAALGQGDLSALRRYRCLWVGTFVFLILLPLTAAHAGSLHPVVQKLAWILPASALVMSLAVYGLFQRATRLSFGVFLRPPSRGRWVRRLTLASVFSILGWMTLLIWMPSDPAPAAVYALVGSTLAFIVLVITGLFTKAFRPSYLQAPKRVWQAYLKSQAALHERRPAEALQIADEALPQKPADPWLLTTRAIALLRLERINEAEADLKRVLLVEKDFSYAAMNLAAVRLIKGDAAGARDLLEGLTTSAPADPTAWQLRGLAEFDVGELPQAEASFSRAAELKVRNAPALAGRALVFLESGGPSPGVDGWIAAARSAEPRHSFVILATARCHERRGEADRARESLHEALAVLREEGRVHWIPYYERLGLRWGILENAA